MAFTIYTVSDPATVGAALSGMAMFFGQDNWVGSAVKTGLLLSLLFILVQGVTRNGLRLDVMVVQLIVVWVMFMPKTTVTVEQFDNAAPPRVVDDVPYAIALPASMAGAFALYMTNKIEAVMVNVDGDYLSVSGGSHPFTPARALMAITMCPSDPLRCVDQNLVETVRFAVRYCAGSKLANTDFIKSPNVLDSLAETMTLQGQVYVYDSVNPYIPGGGGGRQLSCSEAAAYLRGVAEQARQGNGMITDAMNGLANRSEIKRYSSIARANDNQERGWNEVLTDINKLRDANSKMDSLAFANVTLYSLADTMKHSANAPIDQAITLRRDSSLFEWAKSESQQSMLVSTTAPKFMDILFFIFIASTPIVMFIVAANPQGGLKVAGSYALFGMWTQSWIPMMAIIMSWYQTEIRNMVSPQHFTPEYMAFFMRHAYTTTIAASNMIQQAPYLMFAIMTGSMFALSGMVSKAMPSGKGDSGGIQGGGSVGGGADVMNPSGAKGGIPGAGQAHALYGGQAAMQHGMTSGAVGMSGDGSAALPGIAKLDANGSVQTGSSWQQEQSAAARQQIQTQAQQAYSEMAQMVQSAAKKMGGEKLAQHMTKAGVDSSYDASTGKLATKYGTFDVGGTQTNTKGKGAEVKAGFNASLGFELFGNGMNAAASIAGAINEAVKQEVKAANGQGVRKDESAGTRTGTTVTGGTSGSAGTSSKNGAEYGDTASTAQSLQSTFTKLASQTDSLDKADKATQQAGASAAASVGQQIDGGQVVTNWGAQATRIFRSAEQNDGKALDRVSGLVHSSLTPSQQAAFTNAASAQMQKLDATGSSNTLSRDQVAMAAAWTTLANMAATASSPQEKISAQLAMAELAKASGAGDMTTPLKGVRDGLKTVDDVSKNIAEMDKKVTPAAMTAAAQVNAKLDPKATDTFAADVAARKKAITGEANGLMQNAQGGLGAVKKEGETARQQAEKEIAATQTRALALKPLEKAANTLMRNQSGIPVENDLTTYGFGGDSSLGQKWFGNPSKGKNDGTIGAEGATQPEAPKRHPSIQPGGQGTTPSILGGGATAGMQISVEAAKFLGEIGGGTGGVVTKALNELQSTARDATGGAPQAPAHTGSPEASNGGGSTTVVTQNSDGSGLPNLGIAGGPNLTSAGGGSNTPQPPAQPATAKPYASANAANGDKGGKSKTPTPRR